MQNQHNAVRAMPDIASEAKPGTAGALDWVGMGEIELPPDASPLLREMIGFHQLGKGAP